MPHEKVRTHTVTATTSTAMASATTATRTAMAPAFGRRIVAHLRALAGRECLLHRRLVGAIGFVTVVPTACLLQAFASVPLIDDLRAIPSAHRDRERMRRRD